MTLTRLSRQSIYSRSLSSDFDINRIGYRAGDIDFRIYLLILFLLMYFLSASNFVLEKEYIVCVFNYFFLIRGIS
jgi:hypothetical protein